MKPEVVLDLLRRAVELHDVARNLDDEEIRRHVQGASLTQWTWLSNYYLRQLDGNPWDVPPLITRVGEDVTRWEYGPDKTLTTGDE